MFFWGFLGAAAAEAVNMRALHERDLPRWKTDRRRVAFWGFAAVFAIIGGFMALAHEDTGAVLTRWLAANVGFTWPLLLRRGMGALPVTPYPDVD